MGLKKRTSLYHSFMRQLSLVAETVYDHVTFKVPEKKRIKKRETAKMKAQAYAKAPKLNPLDLMAVAHSKKFQHHVTMDFQKSVYLTKRLKGAEKNPAFKTQYRSK